MKPWILIFVGGGIGSVFRFLIGRWIALISGSVFPYGTFIVNITGCFLIGFFVFYVTDGRFGMATVPWRLFLVTGICGGYTTFSSFSYENIALIQNQQILSFLTYTFGSIALGLLATYTGILVAKNI